MSGSGTWCDLEARLSLSGTLDTADTLDTAGTVHTGDVRYMGDMLGKLHGPKITKKLGIS